MVETSSAALLAMAQQLLGRPDAQTDGSGFSWRHKFDKFVEFLAERCSTPEERQAYLDAALQTKTGGIRVELRSSQTSRCAARSWGRMRQDEVGKLITPDASTAIPLPASVADELGFDLGLEAASAAAYARPDDPAEDVQTR